MAAHPSAQSVLHAEIAVANTLRLRTVPHHGALLGIHPLHGHSQNLTVAHNVAAVEVNQQSAMAVLLVGDIRTGQVAPERVQEVQPVRGLS